MENQSDAIVYYDEFIRFSVWVVLEITVLLLVQQGSTSYT